MTAIEEKGKEIKIIKKLQDILTKEEKKLYPNLIVITSSLSVPLATLFFIINWMHSNFKMIVTMNVRCSAKTAWMGKSLTHKHTQRLFQQRTSRWGELENDNAKSNGITDHNQRAFERK